MPIIRLAIIAVFLLSASAVRARTLYERLSDVDIEKIEAEHGMFSPQMGDAVEQLGRIYNDIDNLTQAEECFLSLIGINMQVYGDNSAEFGYSLCLYAAIKLRQEQNDEAETYLQMGESLILKSVGDSHPLYGAAVSAKGTLCFLNGNIPDAVKCYRRAADIYREAVGRSKEARMKYRDDYAASLSAMQYAAFLAGELSDDFDKDFAAIEQLYEDDDMEISLGDALYYKAMIELKAKAVYMALNDSKRSLDILRFNLGGATCSKYVDVALLHINVLQMLRMFGDSETFIDELIADITENKELGRYGELGALYSYKALGLINLGASPEDAEYYARQAIELSKDENLRVHAIYTLSAALDRLGRVNEAAETALESYLAYREKKSSIAELEKKYLFWINYARLEYKRSPEYGKEVYEKFYDSFMKECGDYFGRRQFVSLMTSYLIDMADIYQDLYAETRSEVYFKAACKAWELTLESSVASREYVDIRSFYHAVARLYAIHGDYKEAMKYATGFYELMAESILPTFAILPAADRASNWSGISDFFETTIPMLAIGNGKRDAVNLLFNSALMSKSILLASERQVSDIVRQSGDSSLEALYAGYMNLNDGLSRLQADGRATDDDRRKVKSAEMALLRHPAVSEVMSVQTVVDWPALQRHIGKNEAAVEFVAAKPIERDGATEYMALLLRSTGDPKMVLLPGVTDSMSRGDVDFAGLYDRVWRPLERSLDGVDKLYFSPAGVIHALPVENFGGDSERSYIRLSSSREIVNRGKSAPESGNAVLFGGLHYDSFPELAGNEVRPNGVERQRSVDVGLRAGVSYLPATLTEVNTIKQRFEADSRRVTLYDGDEGTEERFKALSGGNTSILHLATHGFYYAPDEGLRAARSLRKMFSLASTQTESDRAMFRTGVFLAGANFKLSGHEVPSGREDGILTAREVSTMNLSGTRLAVLSACQSGLGEITGEGVFGMPRALKKAGVGAVLMSLWKVDDEATRILMEEFYTRHLSGMTMTEALAGARDTLRLRPEYDHPRFWAAFVLMDDI